MLPFGRLCCVIRKKSAIVKMRMDPALASKMVKKCNFNMHYGLKKPRRAEGDV